MTIDEIIEQVEKLLFRKCTGLEIFIIGVAFNYGFRRGLKEQGKKDDARP
jgi:hypothetical protein